MNVDRYLERVGISHAVAPNLESLRALHRAHLLSIPYENFDVQLGRPITIDIPEIYDKIVVNRRGGWCYEMNGIFGWALKELGFRVTRATGAVMREMGGDATVGNHLVLKVELDEGVYLADVGFGDGPIEPFAVKAGPFDSRGFVQDISRIDADWWRFRNHPNGAAPSFDFNLAPADESRFTSQCHRLQTEPDSIFVQNVFCFRHTEAGVLNLRGRMLRTVTPDGVSEHLLQSAGEFRGVVENTLGLDIPNIASVWPKMCARHDELFRNRETV
jgi:N-hydroxyarylamine O-acetyltransferase